MNQPAARKGEIVKLLKAESYSTPSHTSTSNDVAAIQYLRGIAATLIVFSHASDQIITSSGGETLTILRDASWAGVDLFFIISGFVMSYATSSRRSPTSHPRWAFIQARLARILPLYWAATITTAALALLAPNAFKTTVFSTQKLIFSLLFLPVPDAAGNLDPLLHLGWTLNYEMFFYVCFALFLTRSPATRTLSLFALFTFLFVMASYIGKSNWIIGFYGTPLTLEFVAGCAIALAFKQNNGAAVAPLTAMIIITCGLVMLLTGAKDHTALDGRVIWKGIPVALIIIGAINLEPTSIFRRLTQSVTGKLLHAVGDSTYSIYLTHIFIVMLFRKTWMSAHLSMSGPLSLLFICTCMAGAISIGLFVHYCPYVGERAIVKKAKGLLARAPFALSGRALGSELSGKR